MFIDEIISIRKCGTADTRDITNNEKDFYLNEPNYICQDILVHNSGVIISDTDLDDKIPIVRTSDSDFVSGFQESGGCVDLLHAGFIKFDILGVNNLDIIRDTISEVEKNTGRKIDYLNIPEEEPRAFDTLQKDVTGIFQLGSDLFRKLSREIEPRNLQELSDLIAIGRPGPLKVGSDKEYRHNKMTKPDNIPQFIEDVLIDSHYVLLYQEQVMKIFMNLGFSEQEADEIRGLLKKIQKLKLSKVTEEEKKKLKELGL